MSNVISIHRRREGGLPAAYQHARMNEQCPNCHALPDEYCHNDAHTRRIPCVARMQRNGPHDETPLPEPQLLQARDFSEPRHHEEA